MKKILVLLMFITMVGALSACGGDDTTDESDNKSTEEESSDEASDHENEEELREFTLEELAEYDGKDGNDAYAAVDGDVYDMTDSSYWNEGNHQNQVEAGKDLTDEIDMDSPHGREVLDRVPRIGTLVDADGD